MAIYHFLNLTLATNVPVGIFVGITSIGNRGIRTRNTVTYRVGCASLNWTVISHFLGCRQSQITRVKIPPFLLLVSSCSVLIITNIPWTIV
ncbi:hypothetical protein BDV40DRAFT_264825 [Aspergillus tamarii]|uniref:Uncharacterized protein n=1 Tax=Aspergillus tamarii TaxID=41984 RepID=A0A5N6UXQ3_ASPTM|nr:hypothetical protein BDV40DRAFT_264825 [Aspergillus tamarii]